MTITSELMTDGTESVTTAFGIGIDSNSSVLELSISPYPFRSYHARLSDVLKLNADAKNFRIFGPDETMSNRLYKCFEATQRDWNSTIIPGDEFLAHDGRIMDSMLSEHMCEGWLEGYLLTGRHGFFASYESFIRVVDSMVAEVKIFQ